MYDDNTKFYVHMNRQKATIRELESKISQLEKELCPECEKKFKRIFKET